jgi:hypothetical protein
LSASFGCAHVLVGAVDRGHLATDRRVIREVRMMVASKRPIRRLDHAVMGRRDDLKNRVRIHDQSASLQSCYRIRLGVGIGIRKRSPTAKPITAVAMTADPNPKVSQARRWAGRNRWTPATIPNEGSGANRVAATALAPGTANQIANRADPTRRKDHQTRMPAAMREAGRFIQMSSMRDAEGATDKRLGSAPRSRQSRIVRIGDSATSFQGLTQTT